MLFFSQSIARLLRISKTQIKALFFLKKQQKKVVNIVEVTGISCFHLKIFFFASRNFSFLPSPAKCSPSLAEESSRSSTHKQNFKNKHTRVQRCGRGAEKNNNKFIFYLLNENKRDHAKRAAANQFLRPNATNRRSRLTHGKVAKNLSDRTSSLLLFANERRKNGTSKSDGAGKRPSEWFRTVVS